MTGAEITLDFATSTDYGMFLLSRVREARLYHGLGLRETARRYAGQSSRHEGLGKCLTQST